jgi:hypothetical protein
MIGALSLKSARPLVLAFLVLLPATGEAGRRNARAGEVLLLPRFCWAQFNDAFKNQGPQFRITRCGVGMNHYCPALLELNRSYSPSLSKGQKIQRLTVARRGTEYTLHWMKNYPDCPIRAHVEKTLREVNARLLRFR